MGTAVAQHDANVGVLYDVPRRLTGSHLVVFGHATQLHSVERDAPVSLKLVATGSAEWQTRHVRYRLEGGEGYLILNAHEPYTLDIASGRLVETFCVYFAPGFVESAVAAGDHASALDNGEDARAELRLVDGLRRSDDQLGQSLRRLHTEMRRRPMSDDDVADHVFSLARVVADDQAAMRRGLSDDVALRPSTRTELARRLQRARDLIESSLDRPVALAEMARAAALSPHHFHRTFTAAFGETPHDFAVRRRLEQARALLARTRLPVADVCEAVGFSSLGSFATLFRRRMGMTPGAFRRAAANPQD